jgi:hypothetical protein
LDEAIEAADEAPGEQNDSLGSDPGTDFDNAESDENSHLDDEDAPIVQARTRARGKAIAAE